MVDRFTEVTRTSYGKRIGRSFGGVVLGIILFFGSFIVLFWNEGRVDVSNIAKTATAIEAETANKDASLAGQLISTTGTLAIEETLGDDYLQAGDYVILKRTVEMYAWVEETEEKTETSLGGSEETTTTYEYTKDWVEDPADSSDFRYPEDHYNPAKTIESKTQTVSSAKVGVYAIDPAQATMPSTTSLTLSEDKVILDQEIKEAEDIWTGLYALKPETKLSGNYISIGVGTLQNPQVGDMRISYSALKPGIKVTAFGQLDGTDITTYVDQDNNKLYRVFTGTRDEAIATMHTEYVTSTWIFRVVGFLIMWIGLSMFLAPLSTILDFLPFLGRLSRSLVGIVTFIVSLVLSVITILVSMVIHNLIVLVIVLVVIAVIAIFLVISKAKRKSTPGPSAPTPPPAQTT